MVNIALLCFHKYKFLFIFPLPSVRRIVGIIKFYWACEIPRSREICCKVWQHNNSRTGRLTISLHHFIFDSFTLKCYFNLCRLLKHSIYYERIVYLLISLYINILLYSISTAKNDPINYSWCLPYLRILFKVEALQRRIAPHLLRRVKEDVAKDIPPKEETIIDVELTTMQKQYYRFIIVFINLSMCSFFHVQDIICLRVCVCIYVCMTVCECISDCLDWSYLYVCVPSFNSVCHIVFVDFASIYFNAIENPFKWRMWTIYQSHPLSHFPVRSSVLPFLTYKKINCTYDTELFLSTITDF